MYPILINTTYFVLYAYPLFMGLAWGIGYYLTKYLIEKNQVQVNLVEFFIGIFISSWVGAKVFFILFSSPTGVEKYLYANEFWLGGGFVFYGGLILGLLFFFIYSLWLKRFPISQSYLLIPSIAFGHAVGRVGCFFAGCCYGGQCDLPWAIKMHGEMVHPVQLYEVFSLAILGGISLLMIKKEKKGRDIIAFYLLSYAVVRYILEFFRGDGVRGVYWNTFSTSQLISIAVVVATLIVYLILAIRDRHQTS